MPDRFAYCFDHGRTHHFAEGETPWCDAAWVWLDGDTEDQALANKQARFGAAQFEDQLAMDQRLAIINGEIPGQRTEESA